MHIKLTCRQAPARALTSQHRQDGCCMPTVERHMAHGTCMGDHIVRRDHSHAHASPVIPCDETTTPQPRMRSPSFGFPSIPTEPCRASVPARYRLCFLLSIALHRAGCSDIPCMRHCTRNGWRPTGCTRLVEEHVHLGEQVCLGSDEG